MHSISLPFPPSLGLMWLQMLLFFCTTHEKYYLGCAVAFHRRGRCSDGFEGEEPAAVVLEDCVGGEQPGGYMSSMLHAGNDPESELSPESPTFVSDCCFQEKEEEREREKVRRNEKAEA